MVRERITVSGGNRVVSGAAVRIAKTSGTGNLVVRLEDANGTLIDSFSAPTATGSGPELGRRRQGRGLGLRLVHSTPHPDQRRDLQPAPVDRLLHHHCGPAASKQGDMYGFHPSTYFDDGLLEVSTNAGSTWSQVPGLWQDGDLQFYLN